MEGGQRRPSTEAGRHSKTKHSSLHESGGRVRLSDTLLVMGHLGALSALGRFGGGHDDATAGEAAFCGDGYCPCRLKPPPRNHNNETNQPTDPCSQQVLIYLV